MPAKLRRWIAGAVWLLSSVAAHAQHWAFQSYGPESGLTNPTVLALHQDRQGFLWVSTEGGLFRYDGDRFRTVEARLPGNAADITSLHTSPDGQLWAASIAGLFHWSGDRFLPVPGLANLELESGQALASDSHRIYLASNSGLWSLPLLGKAAPRRLTSEPASSVFVAHDQTVWFGCGSSLCTLQNGQAAKWKSGIDMPAKPWNSITQDSGGNLWIRSAEQVYVKDTNAAKFREIARPSSTHRILLVPGRRGEVFVPHIGGLSICTLAGCRNYGAESGLQDVEPLAVNEDREGSLWVGYAGRGLARWLGREDWQGFAEAEGLSNLEIWRIVRDRSGHLWVGTDRGLFEGAKQGSRWHFSRSSATGDATIYGLLADPDGSLWIGTFHSGPKGLMHYNPKTGHKTIYPPALPMDDFAVKGIVRDSAGAIWVATPKQVMRLNLQSHRLEKVDLLLSGSAIYSIFHTADALYVSGRKGLYIERGGVRRLLTAKEGLKDTAVQSVTIGPTGEVWISYFAPVGLSRLDWNGEQFRVRHFSTAEGLTSNSVYSQFFDARGRHWIGTDSGLAVFEGNRWIRHDISEGLISNDCNSQAFYVEPDGAIWVGTSGGLSRFFSTQRTASPIPSTLITAVIRNDAITKGDVFDSATRTIALRFTMLSYLQQNPLFRYRLGHKQPWIETHAREVHFAELPAGSYHFEVQGRVGTDAWSYLASRDFRILPPWFRDWRFLATAISILAALIWLGWRRRERNERRLRADLEAAVAERTRSLAAATARAEQESRYKGEFLANMSHEMRTPLNGVLGLTKLALELSNQPEVISHLSTVQFSAKLLLSLINDVLDLAKIDAGMMEIVPVDFAPRQLFEDISTMLQPEARRKGLLLETSVAAGMPECLHADDCRLQQVLLNLIGNAIKFTETGKVEIEVWHDGTHLQCRVRDTGIGIAPAQQQIVFDVFRQADSSTSRRHGGSGLGLAISLKLVTSMGGSIKLESEPGRGSVFSFNIVAPIVATPQHAHAPLQEQPLRSLRILVAEDNKVNQHLLLALLRKRGHSPVVANNGREALAAYKREHFDLLLMDIQMPEMDGIEAVRQIRGVEASTRTRTPVIAITARSMLGDRDQIIAAGMDDFLQKPILADQLDAVLNKFGNLPAPVFEFEHQINA